MGLLRSELTRDRSRPGTPAGPVRLDGLAPGWHRGGRHGGRGTGPGASAGRQAGAQDEPGAVAVRERMPRGSGLCGTVMAFEREGDSSPGSRCADDPPISQR
jgi:hypothetical protein